jgi:bacterioferritin-associated ferredoxin
LILCVCNALRENQVREAARSSGSKCPKSAYAALGCRPKCGQCLPHARALLGTG